MSATDQHFVTQTTNTAQQASSTEWDFDLFVIGAGSGGVRASRKAAEQGVRVAIAEASDLGGTCVNLGCVPKKLFVYASEFPELAHFAHNFGVDMTVEGVQWQRLKENKNAEIARLNGIYHNLLENSGVELIRGSASLLGPHSVEVNGQIYRAKTLLLAVGGKPFRPNIPGAQYTWTSDDMFQLDCLPKRLLVVGSGYIAVEFAGIMNGLGVNTWLAYRAQQVLRGFDEDIRVFASQEIAKKGVRHLAGHQIQSVTKLPSGSLKVDFEGKDPVEVDAVLMCTGREAKVEGLGLEKVGIELNKKGLIDVDEHFKTACDSIYALGDITEGPALTPVAIAEAMTFVAQQYLGIDQRLDYSNIATAVFSQPPIATVGLTEAQAKTCFKDIQVFKSEFRALKHTVSGSTERTLMKLIVEVKTDKVVGVHMVGEHAGEIMQGIAIALKAGATKAQFDATIGIHPTAAEEFTTLT